MTKPRSKWPGFLAPLCEHIAGIPAELQENNLWKRILKNVIATTIVVTVAVVPANKRWLGNAAYLGAIASVFGHPGRRFGQMAEANILLLIGTFCGVGWAILSLYLSSLVVKENPSAAFGIRGLFFAIAAMVHGFMRSKFPKLFLGILLMVFVAAVIAVETSTIVTTASVTQILHPIFVAVAAILVVNLLLFPEFSSGFLGQVTIETLNDTEQALQNAGKYFVARKRHNELPKQDGHDISGGVARNKSNGPSQTRKRGLSATIKARVRSASSNTKDKSGGESSKTPSITEVTAARTKIRSKLKSCKAAQQECNFELFFGVLPPYEMKIISSRSMKRLIANTVCIVSACESKFALIGGLDGSEHAGNDTDSEKEQRRTEDGEGKNNQPDRSRNSIFDVFRQEPNGTVDDEDKEEAELEAVKPKREIEFADERLLRYLISNISQPYLDFFDSLHDTFQVIKKSIAYVYGVTHLPSDQKRPKAMSLEELDASVEALQTALLKFDLGMTQALESANALEDLQGKEPDIMPREEVFLVCSFVLNVRQAATHVEDMLKYARELVTNYNQRRGRRRFYFPRIKWSKWLFSGGNEDEALPQEGRKPNRRGQPKRPAKDDARSSRSDDALLDCEEDLERNHPNHPRARNSTSKRSMDSKADRKSEKLSWSMGLRGRAADALEWIQDSEDMTYALKLTVAIFLVLWPAFVPSWNKWYSLNRGIWAALQLIFVLEVSIGTSVLQFIIRMFGVTTGCLWGWAAVTARDRNPIVSVAMVFIGQFPFVYVQLATKYPKGGVVGAVSIAVVSLASIQETVPGTPTENFLKRYIAFLIGGTVALAVEVCFLPVKARTRMIESMASALSAIIEMEKCVAIGIDTGKAIEIVASGGHKRFEREAVKANAALSAAETFLPLTATDPHLKPSPHPRTPIYTELIYLLHQIVDRMENMLALRSAYGSGPLEEFNAQLHAYRRNVAGCVVTSLYAVRQGLVTKYALPQFVPSARVAHLRMINRVREVVNSSGSHGGGDDSKIAADGSSDGDGTQGAEKADPSASCPSSRALRRKYLAWNATSAAQAEIIEFLEELIDLTKLLVGANEFRSGIFARGTQDSSSSAPYPDHDPKDHATQPPDSATAIPASGAKGPPDNLAARGGDTHLNKQSTSISGDAVETGIRRRRTTTTASDPRTKTSGATSQLSKEEAVDEEENEIPASLMRIQSRKRAATLQRRRRRASTAASRVEGGRRVVGEGEASERGAGGRD